jgi:hypothetical protein
VKSSTKEMVKGLRKSEGFIDQEPMIIAALAALYGVLQKSEVDLDAVIAFRDAAVDGRPDHYKESVNRALSHLLHGRAIAG